MLVEYQMNLTVDHKTSQASAYLMKSTDDLAQWTWLADTIFGPFDTATDVSYWLVNALVRDKALHLR